MYVDIIYWSEDNEKKQDCKENKSSEFFILNLGLSDKIQMVLPNWHVACESRVQRRSQWLKLRFGKFAHIADIWSHDIGYDYLGANGKEKKAKKQNYALVFEFWEEKKSWGAKPGKSRERDERKITSMRRVLEVKWRQAFKKYS